MNALYLDSIGFTIITTVIVATGSQLSKYDNVMAGRLGWEKCLWVLFSNCEHSGASPELGWEKCLWVLFSWYR